MKKVYPVLIVAMLFVGLTAYASNVIQRPSPEKILKKLDTNKDGKIDKEEASKSRGGKLVKRFGKIDTNKDGLINLKELKKAMKR